MTGASPSSSGNPRLQELQNLESRCPVAVLRAENKSSCLKRVENENN
jgi:hypothetical protein